jgi:hypothetical protein
MPIKRTGRPRCALDQGARRDGQESGHGTNTVYNYTTLRAAAALARASAAHLAEELAARRATGHLPTRDLCRLLPVACWLHDELAAFAAREGGQP